MPTPEQVIQNLSIENIKRYAAEDGAYELLTSLQRHVLSEGIVFTPETFNFEVIFMNERENFARVAFDVIRDYAAWAKAHPHE
jgi:hypothetical protein